ncbi:TPA: acyltransferase domain-containing protein [Salmonella enterica subsp. enterica serovar Java]|nr:acyltransferase domain-containing protein [Salmonella enterica subsp. enterica serovar Java]
MNNSSDDIAIVSMSGRYPRNMAVPELWQLLLDGGSSVSEIPADVLAKSEHAGIYQDISYVPKYAMLREKDMFDAGFFRMNRSEAMLVDPQQRLFLTCCLEALDLAGLPHPTESGFKTGVFATTTINTYLILNIFKSKEFFSRDKMQILLANEKDFISSRVAYKLNLTGPAITVQTACSSSLVAIHEACSYLRRGDIDLALAGGASLPTVGEIGYLFTPGGAVSSDGKCKAFDEKADGTIFTDGVGVIALCRLADAIDNGLNIYAVIKGSAVNNNGNDSLNIAAPSVHGQAEVIASALRHARVDPADIDFIEAHGTGTYLGDPIEVKALTMAFANDKKQYCALGSIKSNVGHTDTTSGVTGVIKAALALKNRVLPATINYTTANPQLDIENTPFFICDRNYALSPEKETLYAGVSSFGFGGTNAHAILASPPANYRPATTLADSGKAADTLLLWSDRSEASLKKYVTDTFGYFARYDQSELAAIAYTLGRCRHEHEFRAYTVAGAVPESQYIERVAYQKRAGEHTRIVFLYPGQGTGWVDVYTSLYRQNETFRQHVDTLSEKFRPYLGEDIRTVLFPGPDELNNALEKALQTKWSQPALFIISSGLFRILRDYGITPDYHLGHSLGELVAAWTGGMFSEDDAVKCVASRALLMNDTPDGSMLIVFANHELFYVLPDELQAKLGVAAINNPSQFVLSGQERYIADAARFLNDIEIKSKTLAVSKAFHSELMDGILPAWEDVLNSVAFNDLHIPLVSNLTGDILSTKPADAVDYWIEHLRNTVRFADGVNRVIDDITAQGAEPVFVELGAAKSLSTLSLMNCAEIHSVSAGRRDPAGVHNVIDQNSILQATGQLWSLGCRIDLSRVIDKSYVVELPVAGLNPESYWIEPDGAIAPGVPAAAASPEAGTVSGTKRFSPAELETLTLGIWRKIILNENITTDDDFFLLGGDSLQALEITREFKSHGVNVGLADVLTYSTIRQLNDFIMSSLGADENVAVAESKAEDFQQAIDEEDLNNIFKQLNMD